MKKIIYLVILIILSPNFILANEIYDTKTKSEIIKELDNQIKINNIYKDKIYELESQISNLNSSIGNIIKSKDDTIKKCKEELNMLEENSKSSNETKGIPTNEKLNNYMLKINGKDKINLFCIYILILIIGILYFIYKMRKKSIKK